MRINEWAYQRDLDRDLRGAGRLDLPGVVGRMSERVKLLATTGYTAEEAERLYPPPSVADARQIAREMVEEWEYEQDPHGYCHVRPMLISFLRATDDYWP
jgi:hypothetical protein